MGNRKDAGGAVCTSVPCGSLASAGLEFDGFFGAAAICGRRSALDCLTTFFDALLASFFDGRSCAIVGDGSGKSSPPGGRRTCSGLNHWDKESLNSLMGPHAARPKPITNRTAHAGAQARIGSVAVYGVARSHAPLGDESSKRDIARLLPG